MKKTIKKYHLRESIKKKMQEVIVMLLISIFGVLALVGLIAITNARIERIENNQEIIENNK